MPAGQLTHMLPDAVDRNVPAGHEVQTLDPCDEYVPAVQAEQTLAEAFDENLPDSHGMQAIESPFA